MAKPVKLVALQNFDDRALADLREVGPIDFYLNEFRRGVGVLFAVMVDGVRDGSVLLRREQRPDNKFECVVVAGKVRNETSVLRPGLDEIERIARQVGCTSMRVHTDRRGLLQNILKRNPDAEAVVEWKL